MACGKCVEVCPAGAAKLGRKLCKADGTKQVYEMHELPDDMPWGEDKWDKDYRDHNKENCYETGTSPCKTACPAHIAVQGYVKMAADGRYEDAVALIRKDNPFPAVCGDICNRRCEDRCTRGLVDAPVAIDDIKKFLSLYETKNIDKFVLPCENMDGNEWTEFPIAIIGAGPAGLSATYYLRLEGYPVTVFEKQDRPGGMLLNGIPSFRLDKTALEAEIEVIEKMGAEIRCGVEVGKDVTIEELRKQGYKAFYVAIGLQGGRLAGVPGEDAKGVLSGVEFLSDFAHDEKHEHRLNGDVVVVGGGNVACDVARAALRSTDGKVTMLCLEQRKEMPASAAEVAEAEEEGIEVKNGWGPMEVKKDASGNVTTIVFKKCTQVKDADGRFNPQYDESDTLEIPCGNVLMAIGQAAVWGDLLKNTKCELRRGGTIVADPVTLQTAEPDIFAGGDIEHGARFAIDAIGNARIVTQSINRFVHPGQSMTIGRDLREFIELDRDDIDPNAEGYDNCPRRAIGHREGDRESPMRTFALPSRRSRFTRKQIAASSAALRSLT